MPHSNPIAPLIALVLIGLSPLGVVSGDFEAALLIKTQPSEAEIHIDGELKANRSPALFRLAAGQHVVKVTNAGFSPYTETLVLANESLVIRDIQLQVPPLPAYTEPTTGLEFVRIAKGCFQMGSPSNEQGRNDDERRHQVCIDEDFYLGTTEVTRGQFARFARETNHRSNDGCDVWTGSKWDKQRDKSWQNPGFSQQDDHPVACVSWQDATAFAEWLSDKTGETYRLPTEAEWEYATRAGTQSRYWWGDQGPVCRQGARNGAKFDDNAQCNDTGTEPVKSYQANPWGLYDVHGNVWEWTCSAYEVAYDGSEKECANENDSGDRALRGSSWGNSPQFMRSAIRFRSRPENRSDVKGFRLASPLTP